MILFYFFSDNDPLIVDILCILASESDSMSIGHRWFEFGLKLGLTVGDLHDIAMKYNGPLECFREAILLWRSRNMSASCEPVVTSLDAIGRNFLALHIKSYFSLIQLQPQPRSSIDLIESELYGEFSASLKVTKGFYNIYHGLLFSREEYSC